MSENSNDILRQVRKIEIKTRGLSNDIFAGQYHSAFKGRGMAFSEVREYRVGDDVRDIDWNVTARSRSPHVKVYEEERELTMMLLVDVSGSRMFGSTTKLKKNLITEIAAVLAFSATENNDKVGCIFFSDRVEKFIPPKKGRSHILMIIRELIEFTPADRGTDVGEALRYLTNVLKKRSTAFVLSDFMDCDGVERARFEDPLKIASGKHDLVGIRIYDRREEALPDVGILELQDAETGENVWVDTSSASTRGAYADHWQRTNALIDRTLSRCRVDNVRIATDEDYVKSLMKLLSGDDAGNFLEIYQALRRRAAAGGGNIRGGTAFREEDPRGGRATNRGAAWRGAGLRAQCRARCGGFRPGGGRFDPGHRCGGQGCGP